MCLIAEAAFQADLRQGQVRVLDQLLGPGNALPANPVLRRKAGAAFERTGKMTARQGARPCQFSHFQGFAEVVEDQLLGQIFTPGAEPASGFFSRFSG